MNLVRRVDKGETLAKASKSLMFQEPFYGLFLAMLNKEWKTSISTAAVGKNGINYQLLINPIFWESLSPIWQMMIMKHELLHVVFFHIERAGEFPEKDIMNIAADIEVNQYIDTAWLPLGDVKYRDFKEKYEKLIKELVAQVKSGAITHEKAVEDLSNIPPRGVYIQDFHELNLEPKKGIKYYYDKLLEAKGKDPGKGGSEALNDLLQNKSEYSVWVHDWKEFEGMSEAEKKLLRAQTDYQLKEVAEQIVKSRGLVPGELAGYIESLSKKEPPKFDWKRYLRRFVGGSEKTYTKKLHRKYNKRFEDNPGLKIKPKKHILLAVDTSGSVSNEELKEFFHEIYHIQKMGTDITVVQCDASISSIKKYYKGLEDKIAITGRGGTSFDPPVDYFNENKRKFTSMVYFTDGEAPPPSNNPKGRILWVHSSRSTINEGLPGLKIKLEK